jgi:hypothetical protein
MGSEELIVDIGEYDPVYRHRFGHTGGHKETTRATTRTTAREMHRIGCSKGAGMR